MLRWTPATPLRAPTTAISGIEREYLGVLLYSALLHSKRGDLYLSLALSKKDITKKENIYSCLLQNHHVGSISVS